MTVLWCRDGQLILDGTREERRPFEAADADFLNDQSAAYTRALALPTPAGTLLAIGKALHDWLDRKDLLAQIIGESGPVSLDLAVAVRPDAKARAFVAAPWELLTDASGLHLAFDATRAYSPARRFGAPGAHWEPAHRDLSVLFMAAAPEGEHDLAYEREEALILDAVERLPVQLAVEESGALRPLSDRLALEGPFEVLHLTCHGNLDEGRGVLALEDDRGGLDPVTAGRLCEAMGSHRPPLAVVSACRSAEQAGAAVPLALALMEAGLPQVIGWAGSVYDSDAIVFARALYGALGRRETVPAAAAIARRALVEALQRDPEGTGRHWHLARVHLGPNGGGPLCANGKPPRPRPLGDKPFLDRKQQVPVAAPALYVGRRREAQAVLRAFSAFDGPAGVLIRGMGRLGKSSLAARIARRRPDLRSAVVFGRYDARAIFDELVEAIDARHRAALRTAWLDEIARDPQALKDAIEAILTGPAAAPDKATGHQPILLVIDDLERILEPPRPGETRTLVKAEARAPLKAVIEAFAAARTLTESRLLLTSRYRFSLPVSRGDAADALLDLQLPPLTEGQRRKLARAELSRGVLDAEVSEDEEALAGRALAAAGGNPGLQALLTRPIPSDPDRAEAAIAAVESYRASGALPEGDVGQFFSELTLTTYRDALAVDEARAVRAARSFTLPVPRAVMETAADMLGVPAPAQVLERLIGLGCLDVFRDSEKTDLAVNALAAPLFAEPEACELAEIARAVVTALLPAWRAREGRLRRGPEAVELLRLAEAAGNVPDILVEAATAAAAWAWFYHHDAHQGLTLIQKAITESSKSNINYKFYMLLIGIECADRLGNGATQDLLIGHGTCLTSDPDHAGRARFLTRYGDRLKQKGQLDEARSVYLVAGAQFEEIGDTRSYAVTRGLIADILSIRGDWDEVLRIRREEELPIYEKFGDMRSRAVTTAQIADIFLARGDIDEALRLYEDEVLSIFVSLGDIRSQVVTWGRIADVMFERGNLAGSLQLYQTKQLPALRNLGDIVEVATTFGKIANVVFLQGNLDESLRIRREEQLPVYERLGHVRLRTITIGQIADILSMRGDLDEALRIRLEEELPVYEQLGDAHSRAVALANVAEVLLAKGNFDGALQIYNQDVLPTFERLEDRGEYAVALGWIAKVLLKLGRFDEGLNICLEKQLPIYKKLGDMTGICHVYLHTAKMRIAKGIYNQSCAQIVLEDLNEAYRIAEHIGRADAIAAVGEEFGKFLSQIGAATEAAIVLSRSAWAYRKLGHEAQATEIDALIAALPHPPTEPTP